MLYWLVPLLKAGFKDFVQVIIYACDEIRANSKFEILAIIVVAGFGSADEPVVVGGPMVWVRAEVVRTIHQYAIIESGKELIQVAHDFYEHL